MKENLFFKRKHTWEEFHSFWFCSSRLA